MTTYNKTQLKTFFEQNDIPSGSDYANLIDSQLNLQETAAQAMAGALSTTKIVSPVVSAADVSVSDELDAAFVSARNITCSNDLTVRAIDASSMNIASITVSAMSVTGNLIVNEGATIENGLNSTEFTNFGGAVFCSPTIVSAAGTAQATAAPIVEIYMVRLQGAADGTATGYRLPQNVDGIYYLYNENAVSANLWPDFGCKINGLGTNAAFGLTANTLYTVIQYAVSAYAVK